MRGGLILIALAAGLRAQTHTTQPAAAPEISISADGARDLDLYSGWPLIVRATLMHSRRLAKFGDQPPLRIAPPGQSWTDAIQLSAVSTSGASASWPLTLVGSPPDPALTLPNRSYIMVVWQMPGDAVSALAPGTYELTATLKVAGSDGWNGTATSPPVTIRIGPEPSPLTADQEETKAILLAQYAANSSDLATAASAIAGLLASQPDNVNAMTANAALLEQAGLIGPAFFQASDAVIAFFQNNPSPPEMPTNLLTLYNRLFTEFLAPPSDASGQSRRGVRAGPRVR